ncbi:hypothetical protein D1871_05830 [Nakamurella silvestris]|nr:hypothetical protein D1871_05830 [Nakamurella silvestris]
MAQQIRSDNDLPTLRIVMERPSTGPVAVFQVTRGPRDPVTVGRISLRELGVPAVIDGADSVRSIGALPKALLLDLRSAVAGVGLSPSFPASALWLEIPAPRGYLYLLPWERLLAPLNRTLIRLPNYLLHPQAPGENLTVVIAVLDSGRSTEKAVLQLCSAWTKNSHRRVRIHVFADFLAFGSLRRSLGRVAEVTLHNPFPGASTEVDPWLTWISRSLGNIAVDVVQVLAPGTFTRDRGGVALPVQPGNWDGERQVVAGEELALFTTRLGAWCVALAATGRDSCVPALIEMADVLARSGPLVLLVQDLVGRSTGREMDRGVALVCGERSRVTEPLPATTCWVHPQFLGDGGGPADRGVDVDGTSTMVKSATTEMLGRADTPAWLAVGTRYLEGRQAGWLPTQAGSGTGEPLNDPEALDALGAVGRLLDRHAQITGREGPIR